jgi:hypothetical protein
MKFPSRLGLACLLAWALPVAAQAVAPGSPTGTRIYRCGNTYTNDVADAQARGCKLLETSSVTVVPGTRVHSAPPARTGPSAPSPSPSAAPASPAAAATAAAGPGPGPRTDSASQRARDADARFILEAELKKAEGRHTELLKEYNNGEPERLASEARNYQKYLDRVAELKAAVARSEADMAGIRRELSRLSASK